MTGMTAATGNGRRAFPYYVHYDWMRFILEDMGVEVDWRKVEPGEDLSGYDAVAIGAIKLASISALPRRYGALYAATQLPHILLFDDWAIMQVWNSWRPKYLWRDHGGLEPGVAPHKAKAMPYRDQLDAVVNRWFEGDVTGVCCAWDWGDHAKLRKYLRCDLHTIEPTRYYRPYLHDEEHDNIAPVKLKQWASATIANPQDWYESLKMDWPLVHVGKYGKNAKGGGHTQHRAKFTRLPEEEVVRQIYWPSWGTLAVPYPHSGGGWWRQRFYHATETGTISCTGGQELAPLGRCFQYLPREVEEMADYQRLVLAEQQANALWASTPGREAVKRRMAAAFAAAGIQL
jgi:hypothetical protein